jgi:hypothetical protein
MVDCPLGSAHINALRAFFAALRPYRESAIVEDAP